MKIKQYIQHKCILYLLWLFYHQFKIKLTLENDLSLSMWIWIIKVGHNVFSTIYAVVSTNL